MKKIIKLNKIIVIFTMSLCLFLMSSQKSKADTFVKGDFVWWDVSGTHLFYEHHKIEFGKFAIYWTVWTNKNVQVGFMIGWWECPPGNNPGKTIHNNTNVNVSGNLIDIFAKNNFLQIKSNIDAYCNVFEVETGKQIIFDEKIIGNNLYQNIEMPANFNNKIPYCIILNSYNAILERQIFYFNNNNNDNQIIKGVK